MNSLFHLVDNYNFLSTAVRGPQEKFKRSIKKGNLGQNFLMLYSFVWAVSCIIFTTDIWWDFKLRWYNIWIRVIGSQVWNCDCGWLHIGVYLLFESLNMNFVIWSQHVHFTLEYIFETANHFSVSFFNFIQSM